MFAAPRLNRRPVLIAALATLAMLLALPVAAAEAGPKLKNGIYYQPATAKVKSFGYVETMGGKVVSAGFNVRFKDSGGTCVPEGYTDFEGFVNVVFDTNKVKPDNKGKFTVKSKPSSSFPGLKATVSGKFRSSTKASFKATLKAGGCTATASFNKATYTLGG